MRRCLALGAIAMAIAACQVPSAPVHLIDTRVQQTSGKLGEVARLEVRLQPTLPHDVQEYTWYATHGFMREANATSGGTKLLVTQTPVANWVYSTAADPKSCGMGVAVMIRNRSKNANASDYYTSLAFPIEVNATGEAWVNNHVVWSTMRQGADLFSALKENWCNDGEFHGATPPSLLLPPAPVTAPSASPSASPSVASLRRAY